MTQNINSDSKSFMAEEVTKMTDEIVGRVVHFYLDSVHKSIYGENSETQISEESVKTAVDVYGVRYAVANKMYNAIAEMLLSITPEPLGDFRDLTSEQFEAFRIILAEN